jgi:peptidoglycan hydrolase-like protein with peptidoglycan-binding domain
MRRRITLCSFRARCPGSRKRVRHLRWLIPSVLLLGGALASGAPQQKAASSSAKKTKTTPAKKAPAAKKKTAAKSAKSPSKSRARTTSSRRRRPSFRAGQQKPAPERYAEIQKALAQRGYLSAEPDGKWDEASSSALKRFQQDQNLKPDGKINSLSLIALGLGPARTSPAPPAVNPQPPPETSSADPAPPPI